MSPYPVYVTLKRLRPGFPRNRPVLPVAMTARINIKATKGKWLRLTQPALKA